MCRITASDDGHSKWPESHLFQSCRSIIEYQQESSVRCSSDEFYRPCRRVHCRYVFPTVGLFRVPHSHLPRHIRVLLAGILARPKLGYPSVGNDSDALDVVGFVFDGATPSTRSWIPPGRWIVGDCPSRCAGSIVEPDRRCNRTGRRFLCFALPCDDFLIRVGGRYSEVAVPFCPRAFGELG